MTMFLAFCRSIRTLCCHPSIHHPFITPPWGVVVLCELSSLPRLRRISMKLCVGAIGHTKHPKTSWNVVQLIKRRRREPRGEKRVPSGRWKCLRWLVTQLLSLLSCRHFFEFHLSPRPRSSTLSYSIRILLPFLIISIYSNFQSYSYFLHPFNSNSRSVFRFSFSSHSFCSWLSPLGWSSVDTLEQCSTASRNTNQSTNVGTRARILMGRFRFSLQVRTRAEKCLIHRFAVDYFWVNQYNGFKASGSNTILVSNDSRFATIQRPKVPPPPPP